MTNLARPVETLARSLQPLTWNIVVDGPANEIVDNLVYYTANGLAATT